MITPSVQTAMRQSIQNMRMHLVASSLPRRSASLKSSATSDRISRCFCVAASGTNRKIRAPSRQITGASNPMGCASTGNGSQWATSAPLIFDHAEWQPHVRSPVDPRRPAKTGYPSPARLSPCRFSNSSAAFKRALLLVTSTGQAHARASGIYKRFMVRRDYALKTPWAARFDSLAVKAVYIKRLGRPMVMILHSVPRDDHLDGPACRPVHPLLHTTRANFGKHVATFNVDIALCALSSTFPFAFDCEENFDIDHLVEVPHDPIAWS